MQASDFQEVKVLLSSVSNKQAQGQVTVVSYPMQFRVTRAVTVLVTCWVLAAVTILVPLAHFFTVPGFFLAGPIGFYLWINRQSVISQGSGTCPECSGTVTIQKSTEKWPLEETCDHCRSTLSIEKADTNS